MTKGTKTALIVIGGVFLVFFVAVAAGIWWVSENWEGFITETAEAGKHTITVAKAFGETHEQKDWMANRIVVFLPATGDY